MININVVLTCYNRCEKTIKCLNSLLSQKKEQEINLNFFICDDASTDKTVERIRELLPNVHLVFGNGNLFWARGMSLALKEAIDYPCDFLLMINDDVEFYDSMLSIMLKTFNSIKMDNIAISGAIKDPDSGDYSYGGVVTDHKGKHEIIRNIEPSTPPQECERANWNCFLIPYVFYLEVGNIDAYYEHSFADYDYSNRIIAHGGHIYISEEYVGLCKRNTITNTWMDRSLTIAQRLKKLHRPNGVPWRSAAHYWWRYDRKHFFLRMLRPYASIAKDLFKSR